MLYLNNILQGHTYIRYIYTFLFSKYQTDHAFQPCLILLYFALLHPVFACAAADHAPLQRRGPSYERHVTMLLPCCYHAVTMLLPCCYHAVTMPRQPLIPLIGGELPIQAELLLTDVRLFSNLYQSGSDPLQPRFQRFGYGGKERGLCFLTLGEFPDTPGTHIHLEKTYKGAFCIIHVGPL